MKGLSMKRVSLTLLHCGECLHPRAMTRSGGGLSPGRYPAFVGVIRHPAEGLILFDTGYDQAFFKATQSFPEFLYRCVTPVRLEEGQSAVEQLARMGYAADEVRAVVLSHFHGDHVAGLSNFPHARIFCARAGLENVRRGSRVSRVRRGFLSSLVPDTVEARAVYFEDSPAASLPSSFYPFTLGADLLGDGSLLAVDLPGHCPGHWGLALRTDDDRYVLLAADAAWSIAAVEDGVPPPAVTTGLLGHTATYRTTFHQLRLLANRDMVILPSHCAEAAARSGLVFDDPR